MDSYLRWEDISLKIAKKDQSLINRIKLTIKVILKLNNVHRNVEVLPDDIFIVSYPKSGNTWVRFLIGNLIQLNEPVSFVNIDDIIPDIYKITANKLKKKKRPRILKSHEYFDPRYKKVIYITRDPRDVVISYYNYHIKANLIPEDYPIEHYFSHLIGGELDKFGTWAQHVGSWLGARKETTSFLLIRYEDIHINAKSEVKRIASFLGLDVADSLIDEIIARCSAKTMQKLEKRQAMLWKTTAQTRFDKPFIRRAKVGTWEKELPYSCSLEINKRWGHLMRELGYLR